MIAKPGKDPTEVTSYRPISLLPLLSKILEKLLLKRLKRLLTSQQLIPDHQFGFRPRHGTTEQAHRLVHKIHEDVQHKRYSAPQLLLILAKHLIRFGIPVCYTNSNERFRIPCTPFSNPTSQIGSFRWDTTKNTLHYITYNQEYPKGASLVPYYTPSSLLTYHSLITHSLLPMQTIQQYWHPTPIPTSQVGTSSSIWINSNTG